VQSVRGCEKEERELDQLTDRHKYSGFDDEKDDGAVASARKGQIPSKCPA